MNLKRPPRVGGEGNGAEKNATMIKTTMMPGSTHRAQAIQCLGVLARLRPQGPAYDAYIALNVSLQHGGRGRAWGGKGAVCGGGVQHR